MKRENGPRYRLKSGPKKDGEGNHRGPNAHGFQNHRKIVCRREAPCTPMDAENHEKHQMPEHDQWKHFECTVKELVRNLAEVKAEPVRPQPGDTRSSRIMRQYRPAAEKIPNRGSHPI